MVRRSQVAVVFGLVVLTTIFSSASAVRADQRVARVLITVRIVAPAPSFTIGLASMGRSGEVVYGSSTCTLKSPGQNANVFTTVRTVGDAADVVALPFPSSNSGDVVHLTSQGPGFSRSIHSSGVLSSSPHFEVQESPGPVAVITSFAAAP